jgi:hypothetical protein
MSDEIKPDNKNEKKVGDFRPRTLLIWIAIIGVISVLRLENPQGDGLLGSYPEDDK